MPKTPAPVVKLAPTVVRGAKAAATQAEQDGRKRPVVAINEEGKLVVCCRRTAKKNGWQVQDVLYERTKAAPKAEAPAAPAPAKKTPQQRRKTDKETSVVVPKEKLQEAKKAMDSTLDEILGK